MMIAVLTTDDLLLHHGLYADLRQERAEAFAAEDALLVTLLVAVTNFIWNPVGGAVSDRIGRKPVLLTIAGLSFVTAYPALSWLAAGPSFGKMLAVEMMFSFYFGVYSGTMLGAWSRSCRPMSAPPASRSRSRWLRRMFGTFTPFVATKLIDMTGDKASPGLLADVRRGARHHRRADRLSRRPDHRDPRSRHRMRPLSVDAGSNRLRPIDSSMQTR